MAKSSQVQEAAEPEIQQVGSGAATPDTTGVVSGRNSMQRKSARLTYTAFDEDARYTAMVKFLYSRVNGSNWINQEARGANDEDFTGVLIRKSRGVYATAPKEVHPNLLTAVKKLNAQVAFTMQNESIDIILEVLDEFQSDLLMKDGSQLQVLDNLPDISTTRVKRFQYCCLLREERMVLLWHDEFESIIPHALTIEEKLLSLICGSSKSPFGNMSAPVTPGTLSRPLSSYNGTTYHASMDKLPIVDVEDLSAGDEEKAAPATPESLARPVYVTSAVFIGFGLLLVIVLTFGFATSKLVVETMVDKQMIRFALAATLPFLILIGLYFCIVIFSNIFSLIGPIGGLQSNSRYYSGRKPNIRRAYSEGFEPPHITIQMPVYKEGLEAVIKPTIRSLKMAISHYESHGGTASIFVNEDGMNVISEEDAQARRDYYYDHNIGWVARPAHNKDGYVRKGKFKKASNMNFSLNVANKVEDYMQEMMAVKAAENGHDFVEDEELDEMYRTCLDRVLKEDERVTAAGNIRMGEIILLVDSDTRVPLDCLLYSAAEMFLSPEVAILQESIGILQVVGDYFENAMKFFQDLVYTSVNFNVGNGELAPFVGHNAFLRWQAIQSVGRDDPDGYVAYWSESHVSEDFDMALRLQCMGMITRIANYHNNEFLEGVSLTIYDEISRWEKYAYGVTEIVLHPMKSWFTKGPFTPLIRTFLFSRIPLASKFWTLAYMMSYFAISSGGLLTLGNYFLIGWYNGELDKFYMESWRVLVACIAIFNIVGPVCLAVLRYRIGQASLLGSLVENFKWVPLFMIFFAGLPFHINTAIFCHLFSINKQWGATAKEKEASNFFKEVPKIFKQFMYMYIFILILVGGMIYLGCFAPRGLEIKGLTAVFPLAYMVASHALAPFVLNPSIMVFSY